MSATAAPLKTALASSQPKGRLPRILGVSFGIAVIVGDTIGSGILRTPGEVAAHLRSYGFILTVWILGGVYALFCTLSVTELGTMLPFAGGWYVYSRRAMGDFAGFLVGSSDSVVQTVSNGNLAVAFGEFAAELQPAFRGHETLLGVAVLFALALLNWPGCPSAFLVAAVVADLRDALFTLTLIALAGPLYFLFVRKHRVESANVLIGTNALE